MPFGSVLFPTGRNWCQFCFPQGGIGVSSVSHNELVRTGWNFELTPFAFPDTICFPAPPKVSLTLRATRSTKAGKRGRNWCQFCFPQGGIGVSSVSHNELVRTGWNFELTPFAFPDTICFP